MAIKVGNVTQRRYEKLVEKAVKTVQALTDCQFDLGYIAVEIEPIQPVGGTHGAEVYDTLSKFADEIGVEFTTLLTYREVASRWPKSKRSKKASFTVHKHLAHLENRFELIHQPPPPELGGGDRWTCDVAARAAGQTPRNPQTSQERVHRIHDLARDDIVAAEVATDLLRRPEVAHRVMGDHTARHMVNSVQAERGRQTQNVARERTPAIRRVEHRMEVVNLLGACAAFVSAVNRVVPTLHGEHLTTNEREAVFDNLERVRAAADWSQTVVETGDTSMDEQLEQLLRGD
ncbi:DUF6192 family protein [Amycolatopsis sp. lyj-108]|uniref:DUF6192 family protein n=1 Tax=Amycolatopsis sp. lyj-108 TaxID=2789286 RepID=UPI00397CAE9B